VISKPIRELHTVKAVFDKVFQQTLRSETVRVGHIHLALGEMSELDQSMIEHHWNELSKDTPLEHAQLHFRLITAEAQCMVCFKKYHPVNGTIQCPNCGSFGAKILSGEGLYVEKIETDDE